MRIYRITLEKDTGDILEYPQNFSDIQAKEILNLLATGICTYGSKQKAT